MSIAFRPSWLVWCVCFHMLFDTCIVANAKSALFTMNFEPTALLYYHTLEVVKRSVLKCANNICQDDRMPTTYYFVVLMCLMTMCQPVKLGPSQSPELRPLFFTVELDNSLLFLTLATLTKTSGCPPVWHFLKIWLVLVIRVWALPSSAIGGIELAREIKTDLVHRGAVFVSLFGLVGYKFDAADLVI